MFDLNKEIKKVTVMEGEHEFFLKHVSIFICQDDFNSLTDEQKKQGNYTIVNDTATYNEDGTRVELAENDRPKMYIGLVGTIKEGQDVTDWTIRIYESQLWLLEQLQQQLQSTFSIKDLCAVKDINLKLYITSNVYKGKSYLNNNFIPSKADQAGALL